MKLTIADLAEILNGKVVGDYNEIVSSFSRIEDANQGDITFLSNTKYISWLYKTKASVIIIDKDLKFDEKVNSNLILVENSYLAFNKLLNKFSEKRIKYFGIDKLSFIHDNSIVGENISIGKFSVIESDCKIGKNVIIMDGVSIQSNVMIGDNCIIYPGVKIYKDCKIGNNCILHSNCVVGSDGFGFAPDNEGKYIKTPQLGNVEIGFVLNLN